MTSTTPPSGSSALRAAWCFGILLGLVLILLRWLSMLGLAGALPWLLSFVVMLGVYFLAGLRAAQQTGSTQSGAYAGLVTAFISSLLSLATLFAFILLHQEQLGSTLSSLNLILKLAGIYVSLTPGILLGAILLGLLVTLLLSMLLGMAIGAIGGCMGKHRQAAFMPSKNTVVF